jgi:hypothetical protein
MLGTGGPEVRSLTSAAGTNSYCMSGIEIAVFGYGVPKLGVRLRSLVFRSHSTHSRNSPPLPQICIPLHLYKPYLTDSFHSEDIQPPRPFFAMMDKRNIPVDHPHHEPTTPPSAAYGWRMPNKGVRVSSFRLRLERATSIQWE